MPAEARATTSAFHWLEEQFHRLAALEADVRAEEVESLRRSMPTLTQELEVLLRSELAGDGLATAAPCAETVDACAPGRQVGPYRLEREIGRGGMGVVYQALQEAPLRRRVALKVLAGSWDRGQLERFEGERLALARMSHPNVAVVFDAGSTQSGCPFLVMELVDGQPVTRAADAHRASVEQRVQLFCDVCLGVEHAHSKGIIHRDLKPTNVLAAWRDERPLVKVIDFGIAKSLLGPSGPMLTAAGEALGTPAYMSPEQESGEMASIDTRSDVYSLGVLLHELLTGRLPGREVGHGRAPSSTLAANDDSAVTAKRRGTTPERLASRLRGDLDWILLKALAERPRDRYQTVAELRGDLERHLASQPVTARPPSWLDRTAKLVRRNRAASALGVALVVTLVTALLMTLASLAQTRAAERAARDEAATAQRVTDLLVGLFRANLPERAKGRELSAREMLDLGWRETSEQLGESPLLRARLLRSLSEVYGNLGEMQSARQAAADSVAAARTLDGDGRELAESLRRFGWVLRRIDEPALAESSYREALALAESLQGEQGRLVAEVLSELGLVLKPGRPDEALELLQRARRIALSQRGCEDGETVILLSNIGSLKLRLRDYAGALAAFDVAAPLVDSHFGGDDPRVGTLQANRANALLSLGRYAESQVALEAALELDRRLLGERHPSVGQDLMELARVALKLGDLEAAVERASQALGILEAALGTDHPLSLLTRTARAEALVLQGALPEARRDLDVVLGGERSSDDQRSVATYALLTLAEVARLEGDFDRALDSARLAGESAAQRESSLQQERALWSRAHTLALQRAPEALDGFELALSSTASAAPAAQTALQEARFFGWWGCPGRALDALQRSVGLGLRDAAPTLEAAFEEARRSRRFTEVAAPLGEARATARGGSAEVTDGDHCSAAREAV